MDITDYIVSGGAQGHHPQVIYRVGDMGLSQVYLSGDHGEAVFHSDGSTELRSFFEVQLIRWPDPFDDEFDLLHDEDYANYANGPYRFFNVDSTTNFVRAWIASALTIQQIEAAKRKAHATRPDITAVRTRRIRLS